MIRFSCPECQERVRVTDSFAGKKGRCPFCKHIYRIPTESEIESEGVADLAAALAGSELAEPEAPSAPPPPHEAEESAAPDGVEEVLQATDPRSQTMPLTALKDVGEDAYELSEEEAVGTAAGPAAAPPVVIEGARGKGKLWILLIAAAAVIVLAGGAAAAYFLTDWFGGTSDTRTAPGPETRATVTPTPTPTPPKQVAKVYHTPLAPEITAATTAAPANAWCMFHVDLSRTADGIARFGPRAEGTIAQITASQLWTDAAARIAEGSMPTTVTLFLATPSQPASEAFGAFYGAVPGGTSDPQAGLWSLIRPDSPMPQFLLRVGGKAAGAYADELRARAKAIGQDVPDGGQVASAAGLRLVGPSLTGEDVMLLGTARTLGADAGQVVGNSEQLQRLRKLLTKVETKNRPIVGGVVLAGLRAALQRAAGVTEVGPPWFGRDSKLVFSLDPSPASTAPATIVITDSEDAAALEQLKAKVAPMVVVTDGPDIRITGTGREAIPILAELLPGFDEVILKGLAAAGPVRSRVATAQPEPTPEPEPGPVVEPTPEPTPEPAPEPVPPGPPIEFYCVNSTCPSKGSGFKVEASKVPANVLAGTSPLKCPYCGQNRAVPAVQCPHCKKWTHKLLPNCIHCNKPIK